MKLPCDIDLSNDSMKPGAYQMKKEKICIIGCGWLGKPLAHHMIKANYPVIATTAHDKSLEFKANAIPYISFDLERERFLPNEIQLADVLIYAVPPLELSIVKSFFDKVSRDKKIIFTSSTSVYGKNLGHVDENHKLDLSNCNSQLLVETEAYLLGRFKNLTIIRPGGLYGEKRHPVFFLQGKSNLKTGQELLHLVHRDDCINAIMAIINKSLWGEIFNLISDERMEKKDYYTLMASKLNLIPPKYDNDISISMPTNISNEKSKIKLQIRYLDPNLLYLS